jgi:hypothetical protein
MAYPFLVLSLLLLVPGAVVFSLRSDLRHAMGIMALCALPFAFTESLFFPTYWEPRFLFDLVRHIGFGIEDLLFVTGLAGFTTTAYPFVFHRAYAPLPGGSTRASLGRVALLVGAALLLTALAESIEIPTIYTSIMVMSGILLLMISWRRDLLLPGLLGGLLSLGVYGVSCLLLERIIPNVFSLNWHTEKFLNRFLLGIPLEELLYSGAAGATATVFYPFAFFKVFIKVQKKGRGQHDIEIQHPVG